MRKKLESEAPLLARWGFWIPSLVSRCLFVDNTEGAKIFAQTSDIPIVSFVMKILIKGQDNLKWRKKWEQRDCVEVFWIIRMRGDEALGQWQWEYKRRNGVSRL